jgi:hypothetical protein
VISSAACCRHKAVEIARYELSQGEVELVPYRAGQQINFKHSGGYAFHFDVVEDKTEWRRESEFIEMTLCSPNYWYYQARKVVLASTYPVITIVLEVVANEYRYPSTDDYVYGGIEVAVNGFGGYIPRDFTADTTKYHATILINNNEYRNVIETDLRLHGIEEGEIAVKSTASLLYSKEVGIIQLTMADDEIYSIDN